MVHQFSRRLKYNTNNIVVQCSILFTSLFNNVVSVPNFHFEFFRFNVTAENETQHKLLGNCPVNDEPLYVLCHVPVSPGLMDILPK
jgi:hypothetical protein